jgi:hypothetical protein
VPNSDSPELPFVAEIGHNNGPALTGLVSFYDVYCPARFERLKKRRSKQAIIKKLRLPVISVGHSTLIDVEMGDQRLRELAAEQLAEAKARAQAQAETQPQPQPPQQHHGRPAAEIEIPEAPRRGRGRPKGSLNKPKPVPADQAVKNPLDEF